MTIGQLSDFKSSLKYYHKGIELYIKELKTIDPADTEHLSSVSNSLASGYAAMAELYMQSDLWYILNII